MSVSRSSPDCRQNNADCSARFSIHREPVQLRALALLELDTDELDALVEQGLARLMDGETYDVHDLIREFLLLDMDDVTRRDLHIKATDGTNDPQTDRRLSLNGCTTSSPRTATMRPLSFWNMLA